MYCSGASPTVSRCLFRSCHAGGGGGALFYYACQSTPASTTLFDNGGLYGGVSLIHRSVVTLTNSIIALGNRGASIYVEGGGAEAILACCDIYGNAGGDWVPPFDWQLGINGNICADPRFCDASSGDLRLADDPPCAPGQNPACGLIGAWPVGCASGVVGGVPTGSGAVLWSAPNPFVGGTAIGYRLGPASSTDGVSVAICDVSGRLVRTLRAPGATGQLWWDGTDDAGRALPGGIYLLRLAGDGRTVTERVVRIR